MSIIFYGVAYGKIDVLDFRTDFLAGIRANYFSSGNIQQTNDSVQTVDNNEYHFVYNLSYSGALKWKQFVNGTLNQFSNAEIDGSYFVSCLNSNNILFKNIYFNKSHIWTKTDYIENNQVICSVYPDILDNEDVLVIKSYNANNTVVNYLYPKFSLPNNNQYDVLAFTNKGFVYFNSIPNNGTMPKSMVIEQEVAVGFEFDYNDFDLNRNFNENYTIDTAEYLTPENIKKVSIQETVEEYSVIGDIQNPDTVVDSCGDKYSYYGELSANGKRDGYGRTVTPKGITAYEGNYKDDKRNGFGAFYYKNGDINYVGNWQNNYREGYGVGFRSSDFTSHIGRWHNNIPDGIGARFDKNGNFIFLGNFVNGKKQGLGITIDEKGRFIVSYFEDDEIISSKPLE